MPDDGGQPPGTHYNALVVSAAVIALSGI